MEKEEDDLEQKFPKKPSIKIAKEDIE